MGPVENGWDFNDPTAMAGFGAISAAEVAQLASQLLGELPAISETSAVKTEAGEDKPALPQTDVAPNAQSDTSDTTEARRDTENDAAQQNRSNFAA